MEYSEFVLFQTFRTLRKNDVKIELRKLQKNLLQLEHSSSSLECRALLDAPLTVPDCLKNNQIYFVLENILCSPILLNYL